MDPAPPLPYAANFNGTRAGKVDKASRGKLRRLRTACGAALLIAGTLAPATPVLAQQPPAQPPAPAEQPPAAEDQIVVMGMRDKIEAIEEYVSDLTILDTDDPLSRYQKDQYCPAVLGLKPERNAEIAARMRAVAAAADIRPAKEGCAPSALVIFVANKKSFLEEFRKQHPVYFANLQGKMEPRPEEAGPATAWHLVQLLDPQGMPIQRDPMGGFGVVESSTRGSRILSMVQPVVAMSVVVVERSALIGLTPTQIADYALMRSLTDRSPDKLEVPRTLTILGALTAPMGSAVPSSLTAWDLSYLKGRYSGHPSRYGRSQGAAIRRQMRRELARPDDKE